jgi:hypothetical protein
VTQDESQVSVGGLLALDQVLGKPWLCLTIFGTSIGWSKMECPGEVENARSHPFCRIFGFRVYEMGMGCRPMGFTHV